MPLFPTVIKQTERVLEEVLRYIREDRENPPPVLCEADRQRFVEEEKSLRERLKQIARPEFDSILGCLLDKPSPQAAKCLGDAKDLRQRVQADVGAKRRIRLAEMSYDNKYTSDLTEAMNTPLEPQIVRSRRSTVRRQTKSPPQPRRTAQSGSPRLSPQPTRTGNPNSGSTRRSQSVRMPPSSPPPPQPTRHARTPGPPAPRSPPPPGPSSPDAAIMAFVTDLVQHVDRLLPTVLHEGTQVSGNVINNHVNIKDAISDGMTFNNGGFENSGSVIHKGAQGTPSVPSPRPVAHA